MKIPFLDLQKINYRYEAEFQKCLKKVLQAGWFLQGESTQEFEESFSRYCQSSFAVGVANGLDALALILQAQKELEGWKDGDEVILPAHTFVASALAVVQAKLSPVLVDVCIHDALIDVEKIEAAVRSRTRAIMPVHLYGKCCDMERIAEIATQHGLFVVEDAAQAHGAIYHGRKAGSLGDAAAFSFYPGKNLGALGDGGAVVSDNPLLIERVRRLANYGAERKYDHQYLGRNSRLDEIQAAFLSIKLKTLDEDNRRRKEIAKRYLNEISNDHLRPLYPQDEEALPYPVYHLFPILTKHRRALQTYLMDRGIATLIHYPTPIHQQRVFHGIISQDMSFPNAERIASEELSIPISPVMTNEEVDYVIKTLNSFQL